VFLTQHYLAIALEYAAGGDLLDYVNAKGGLDEDEARWGMPCMCYEAVIWLM
jgi:hypothetical protein